MGGSTIAHEVSSVDECANYARQICANYARHRHSWREKALAAAPGGCAACIGAACSATARMIRCPACRLSRALFWSPTTLRVHKV